MLLTRVLFSSLLFAALLPGSFVITNDIPVPAFEGHADADSYDDFGTAAATCGPTSITFVEDPPSSGEFVMDLDAAGSILDCGEVLQGLIAAKSFHVWVKQDTLGGGNLGHILVLQLNSSNRSWQVQIDAGNNTFRASPAYNTSNVGVSWDSVFGAADAPAADYIAVSGSFTCGATLESCSGTVYIDGFVSVSGSQGPTGTIRTADDSDVFYIGNRPAGDRAFNGRIGPARVWGQTLNKFQHELLFLIGKGPASPIAALTTSDCTTLCESQWQAAGFHQPFQASADEHELTSQSYGCRCWTGGPIDNSVLPN